MGAGEFGARYLVLGLGRWASADAATVHRLRSDPNPYSYVGGRPTVAVDPDGNELVTAIVIGAVIGALLLGGAAYASESHAQGTADASKWRNKNRAWGRIGLAAGIGAVAGGTLGGLWESGGLMFLTGPSAGTTTAEGATVTTWTAAGTPSVLEGALIGAAGGGSAGALAGGVYGAFQGQGAGGVTRNAARGAEAGALAGAGAALGAWAGGSVGLGTLGGVSGAANGGLAGWRQIYDWGSPSGYLAFGADSTWGLAGTTLGNVVNAVNIASGANYSDQQSRRQNRQVYTNGFPWGSTFAHTQGNTVSNAGVGGGDLLDHETEHIWANRTFGPLYQGTYLGWAGVFGLMGTADAAGSGSNWYSTVREWAYFDNPWEVHAYDHNNPAARRRHRGLGR